MSAFPDVNWVTESSHPASGLAYQVAEVNAWPGDPHFVPGQFARVVKESEVLYGPQRDTTSILRAYQALVQEIVQRWEREQEDADKRSDAYAGSSSYAEYELAKLDKSRDLRVKFWDAGDGETRKLKVTPETMVQIAAILRRAPENQW